MDAPFFTPAGEGERVTAREHRVLAELPHLEAIILTFEPDWEGVPPHSHSDHTDSFYVLDGEVEFWLDGEWRLAGPGRSSPRRRTSSTAFAPPAQGPSPCSTSTPRTWASSSRCGARAT